LLLFYGWVGLRTLDLGDLGATILLIGQAFGRFGNFFNQELYGYPTSVPWKMFIDPAHRLAGYYDQAFYHPTFFYEGSCACWGRPFLHTGSYIKEGSGSNCFGIPHALQFNKVCCGVFPYRAPIIVGLHTAQLLSLVIIVLCGIMYVLTLRFGQKLFVGEARQTP